MNDIVEGEIVDSNGTEKTQLPPSTEKDSLPIQEGQIVDRIDKGGDPDVVLTDIAEANEPLPIIDMVPTNEDHNVFEPLSPKKQFYRTQMSPETARRLPVTNEAQSTDTRSPKQRWEQHRKNGQ